MPVRIRLAFILAASILALPAAASAQNAAGSAPAVPPPSQQQTLRQLRQQAARLTLVARLPEADRTQATQLLDRATALRKRALALRIQELRAYVDALEAGTSPGVARVQAQQHVADQRLALAKAMAAFRKEAQAFVTKVPQARRLLGMLLSAQGGDRWDGRGPGSSRLRGWQRSGQAAPNGSQNGASRNGVSRNSAPQTGTPSDGGSATGM